MGVRCGDRVVRNPSTARLRVAALHVGGVHRTRGGADLITGAVIQPWATRWSQRGDAAAGIRVGIILGVLGFGAATVVAYTDGALSVAAIVVAAFLLGSCYGILLGSGLASVEKLASADELAQTVAVFYCLIYVGFAVPFVMSLLAPHLGYATCFVGAALLMLLSVAVAGR